MSGLVEALKAAVVTRELDLSELDEAYRDSGGKPLLLFYRANWTRGQKKRRWDLAMELDGFRRQMEQGKTPDAEAVRRNRLAWLAWWNTILMVKGDLPLHRRLWQKLTSKTDASKGMPRKLTAKEMTALAESTAWEWITATVVWRVGEYEIEMTKKAQGGPSATSEELQASPQNSNSE